jgi:hypothetical protein
MKQKLFNLSVIISLFALILLATGFLAQFAVEFRYNAINQPKPFYRTIDLEIGEGRIRSLWETQTSAPWSSLLTTPASSEPLGLGIDWLARFRPIELRSMSRVIWGFDAHSWVPFAPHVVIVACPLWCLAVPFTIAPLIWLSRRRKRPEPRGFAVTVSSPKNG